jgi:hypothetical protein
LIVYGLERVNKPIYYILFIFSLILATSPI